MLLSESSETHFLPPFHPPPPLSSSCSYSLFLYFFSALFFHCSLPLSSHFPVFPLFSFGWCLFVGGEHLKSPLRRTPSATFMNHSLSYLFFHFLPLSSFVVFFYMPASLCGAIPRTATTTLPIPTYCPAPLSILSSLPGWLALWSPSCSIFLHRCNAAHL